jgi:putative flippase GtrA
MSAQGQSEQPPLTVRFRELITHPHQAMEIIRYGSVGIFNNVLYFVLYSAVITAGGAYWAASLVGYFVTAPLGYWLHEHFSFGGGAPSLRGLGKWLLTQVGAILINLGLLTLLIHKAHFEKIPAQLVLLPFIPVISYLLGRHWIFTRANPSGDEFQNVPGDRRRPRA